MVFGLQSWGLGLTVHSIHSVSHGVLFQVLPGALTALGQSTSQLFSSLAPAHTGSPSAPKVFRVARLCCSGRLESFEQAACIFARLMASQDASEVEFASESKHVLPELHRRERGDKLLLRPLQGRGSTLWLGIGFRVWGFRALEV